MEPQKEGILDSYKLGSSHFDEVFKEGRKPKAHYQNIVDNFNQLTLPDYERINNEVKSSFLNQGITFAVYAEDKKADEQIFPFDLFPRIIPNDEWAMVEKGIIQRNRAINLFLNDIYHKKFILKDKVVPSDLIFSSKNYLKEMVDFTPPGEMYIHISG